MKRSPFLYLFIVVALAELAARAFNLQELGWITKPLLMPTLLLYFSKNVPYSPINKFITIALIGSFLGDTLLMFTGRSEYFFLAGLASFLIAHVVYIIINLNLVNSEVRGLKPQWQDLLFVIYGLIIFSVINTDLGNMYVPALLYTIVICLMAITARKRWRKTDQKSFWLIMGGAIAFVVSDSILAIDKFSKPFDQAGFLIMLTYLLAQFMIVQGVIAFVKQIGVGSTN